MVEVGEHWSGLALHDLQPGGKEMIGRGEWPSGPIHPLMEAQLNVKGDGFEWAQILIFFSIQVKRFS